MLFFIGDYDYSFYVAVRRGDVLSAWSGIRPLVSDPNKDDTQSLARNHIVHVSESGLVTIAGGKWTTYRSMASETIDEMLNSEYSRLFPTGCLSFTRAKVLTYSNNEK